MKAFIILVTLKGNYYVAMDCQGSFSNHPKDGMLFFDRSVAEDYVGRIESLLETLQPEQSAIARVVEFPEDAPKAMENGQQYFVNRFLGAEVKP